MTGMVALRSLPEPSAQCHQTAEYFEHSTSPPSLLYLFLCWHPIICLIKLYLRRQMVILHYCFPFSWCEYFCYCDFSHLGEFGHAMLNIHKYGTSDNRRVVSVWSHILAVYLIAESGKLLCLPFHISLST